MHQYLYTLFIALTNNLDNIGVRIAYSIRGVTISPLINAWISLITFVISFLSAASGTLLSEIINQKICSMIAMVLLTTMGLYIIFQQMITRNLDSAVRPDQDRRKSFFNILWNPENADMDNSKNIDFKEATFLALGLSINNVGGAVSAGMIGLNSFWVGFFSAVLSFLALWGGNYLAEALIKWNITHKANLAGGILLILIGLKQVFN